MKISEKYLFKYGLSLVGTILLGWVFYKVDSPKAQTNLREPTIFSIGSNQKNPETISRINSLRQILSGHENSVDEFAIELKELNKCYLQDCGFEKTDPRTEYFTLGQKIRQKLLQLQALVQMDEIVDPKVSQMAREFVENSDGHVQEAALDLISTQEPAPENLKAILDHIIKGNDSELIQQALLELRRYPSPEDQETIRQTLAQVILTGAPFVAQAVAEKSELFINSQNIEFFENLTKKIDPQSIVGVSLQSSLREYRRKSSAG